MRISVGAHLTFDVSRGAPRARHRRERRPNWPARTLVTTFAAVLVELVGGLLVLVVARLLGLV